MALSIDSNTLSSLSISDTYAQCVESLRVFVEAVRQRDCLVRHLELVSVSDIGDEYGRAMIWGDETKACLPENARGSLDDTLRHDAEMKDLVLENLHLLCGILEEATHIAKRRIDPALGSDQDSLTSVSDESDGSSDTDSRGTGISSSSTHSGPGNDTPGTRGRRKGKNVAKPGRRAKICVLVEEIKEQIKALFDIASLLRRPRVTDKYLHSVSTKSHNQAGKSDIESLMTVLSIYDEKHVMEKFLQWRLLGKDTLDTPHVAQSANDEVTEAPKMIPSFETLSDIEWFCNRLARANTRRREQLKYWERRPYKSVPTVSSVQQLPKQGRDDELQKQIRKVKPETSETEPTLTIDHRSSSARQTISTVHTYSTAALSDVVHNTNMTERAYTTYAPTAVEQGRRINTVPEPPKPVDGASNISCLYCGMELDKDAMQNRQAWKRHVFHDLRPYVCTFQSCSNGDKLFASRSDWIYHELLVHRRRYVCNQVGCGKVHKNKNEFLAHLQNDHYPDSRPMLPGDVAIIVDLCNRPVDISERAHGLTCIVCHEPFDFVERLQKHLASHMEDIALFVLPGDAELKDTEAISRASIQISAGGSTESYRASSLSWPASADLSLYEHIQTPENFAALGTREEDNLATKMTNWIQEDPESVESRNLVSSSLSAGPEQNPIVDDDMIIVHPEAVSAYLSKTPIPFQPSPELYKNSDNLDNEIVDKIHSISQKLSSYMTERRFLEAEKVFLEEQTSISLLGIEGFDMMIDMLSQTMHLEMEKKDRHGKTPLSCAASEGCENVAKLLLKMRANIEASDVNGRTPLACASFAGYDSIVLLLLESGANVDAKDKLGWTPLLFAAWKLYEGIIRCLLENGANVEAKNSYGKTALLFAAQKGHKAVIQLLLDKGANIEAVDKEGIRPLSCTAKEGHVVATRLLLERGADIETRSRDGATPLIHAAQEGNEGVIRLLLEKGANINAQNENSQTPLSCAVKRGDKGSLRLLLEMGAHIKFEDFDSPPQLGVTSLNTDPAIHFQHQGFIGPVWICCACRGDQIPLDFTRCRTCPHSRCENCIEMQV